MKKITALILLLGSVHVANAQGCSDAGFCTIGNFNTHETSEKMKRYKNEVDFSYTYGTHLKNERFYQPQLNYRFIKKEEAYFEIRLPFNTAKDKRSGTQVSGIGDATVTYNSKFVIGKKQQLNYSAGLRISLSDAGRNDMKTMFSYPMFLQNGLGTTDLLAVVSYDVLKYFSVGTGVQLPVFQYNKNKLILYNTGTNTLTGEGFRRKPDALLKLSGHYKFSKLKINAGILGIFHLANDYYHTTAGKFILENSKGTTINLTFYASYPISKTTNVSFLYAEPLKTRRNIPDGLARSKIFNPKLTIAF